MQATIFLKVDKIRAIEQVCPKSSQITKYLVFSTARWVPTAVRMLQYKCCSSQFVIRQIYLLFAEVSLSIKFHNYSEILTYKHRIVV